EIEWKRRTAGLPAVSFLFARHTAQIPVRKGIAANARRISTRNIMKYLQWNSIKNYAAFHLRV
ncbi:MAG: hypothetical protein WBM07_18480, partial [Chitinivibrionales bacterium]